MSWSSIVVIYYLSATPSWSHSTMSSIVSREPSMHKCCSWISSSHLSLHSVGRYLVHQHSIAMTISFFVTHRPTKVAKEILRGLVVFGEIDCICQCCASLLPDRLCTKAGKSCLTLPVPLVVTVWIPLLPQNSPRPDTNLYLVLGSYTLYTILPPGHLGTVFVLVLTFVFPNPNFGPALGFAKLPTLDPIPRFRVAALLPPALLLGLRSYVVARLTSDMTLMMWSTKRSDMHPSRSCWPREWFFSTSDQNPMESHQASS